jgi:ABC-type branched-subunit amino acid transport system substrate-binding protein
MIRKTRIGGWLALLLLLSGCIQASTVPVYTIGVVMPLEGAHRARALDAFFASRAAILDALHSGAMTGYRVELVTVDDFGNPEQAAAQARALVRDDRVLAVIGHWLPDTTRAALPIYTTAGVPLITTQGAAVTPGTDGIFVLDAPPATYDHVLTAWAADNTLPPDATLTNAPAPVDLPDGDTLRDAILAGDPSAVEPGWYSVLAYDATRLVLDAIQQAAATSNLTRDGVQTALQTLTYSGVTGPIAFDPDGYRVDAPLYLYTGINTGAPSLVARLQ